MKPKSSDHNKCWGRSQVQIPFATLHWLYRGETNIQVWGGPKKRAWTINIEGNNDEIENTPIFFNP